MEYSRLANRNYERGRRLEWSRRKLWQSLGYHVIRASSSKGFYDLVAIQDGALVHLIQCKIVQTKAQAHRMLRAFEKNPPMPPSEHFIQVLEVSVPHLGVFSTSVCA